MTNHAAVLAALADPTRRAIFERLARSPHAVGELARELPVSRPAVSQHLRVLKEAGLVRDHRIGNRRVYRLHPPGGGAPRGPPGPVWSPGRSPVQGTTQATPGGVKGAPP